MIINKITKGYQMRNDKPNENWLNDSDFFVVDDNSEIANKIIKYYPYIDLIIENDEIINVVEDEEFKEIFKNRENILKEINELKENLTNTDYQALKYAEGHLSEEEYSPMKEKRQAWRDRINELEASLEVQDENN